MKAAKPIERTRGRRRFKTKPSESNALPYGDCHQVLDLGERCELQEYLPKTFPKELLGLPLNFQQTADFLLGRKRQLSHPPELLKKLEYYEQLNNASPHPYWNAPEELPPELLREALSQCPEAALRSYAVVRRALARLYSVAGHGRGPDAVKAKAELEQLIPTGNQHPITKHFPEIIAKFRELRDWILESDKLMQEAYPIENPDRWRKLAELYGESTGVISEALDLKISENQFIENRLVDVLGIPLETARKTVAKSPR